MWRGWRGLRHECIKICVYILVVYTIANLLLHIRISQNSKCSSKMPQPEYVVIKEPQHQVKGRDSEMVVKIKGSNEFVKIGENPNFSKYFIYTCDSGCGGWGDRQKGIITAYLISLLTNRRFGITHRNPCNITRYLAPNEVMWDIEGLNETILTDQLARYTDDLNFRQKFQDKDLDELFSDEIIHFLANQDHVREIRRHYDVGQTIPWLSKMSNADVYFNLWNLLFEQTNEIKNQVNDFMTQKISGKGLVCAHIRMGKNPTIPQDEWTRYKQEDIDLVWNFFKKFKKSSYKLFIASDSEQVKEEASVKFPTMYVDIPGKISHIDLVSGDDCEGFQKAILDQIILTKCDVLVLTYSGYSLMSSYLRGTSAGLFCLFRKSVIPCSRETVQDLYEIV